MVAQTYSRSMPNVHAAADVHEFSLVEGDVRVGAGAVVAPGTAVTAEPGASVVLGDRARLLPGVIVEASKGPKITGNSGSPCSIWVGEGSAIAHKSLIHSPAYIGKGCFIGFRSTVYNARIGDGCVVMMHVLVQDVEVPPGKYIPSGSVITSQHQADQLPNVRAEDIEFAKEIVGEAIGAASGNSRNNRASSSQNRSKARLVPIQGGARRSARQPHYSTATDTANKGAIMQNQRLAPETVQQVRQYLSSGYRIGMEHADQRRYRSGVWETCTPIKETNEQAVFAELERCLAEHEGEYVRIFGIDTKAKSRVGMATIQRPGDKPTQNAQQNSSATTARGAYGSSSKATQAGYPHPPNRGGQRSGQNGGQRSGQNGGQNSGQNGGQLITPGIAQEVRNLLSSGYIIGTEHAGPRHYRSNVWKVCSPIDSRDEREVFSRLEHCLDEHSGEYVRMFGINPGENSRSATTTIQRGDGRPVKVSTHAVPNVSGGQSSAYSSGGSGGGGYSQSSGSANSELAQAVKQIISGGNKVGVEVADQRRYRSGIWQTAPAVKASSASAALNQLQGFLDQNSDKYVRIFGIDTEMKTRGSATTVQKPGQSSSSKSGADGSQQSGSQRNGGYDRSGNDPINANPPHYDDPSFRGQPSSYGSDGYSAKNAGGMAPDVMDQVTQLVNQGHKISVEYADKRRFRSGIWKTGGTINARRPAEAISALGKQLAQHKDNYVRLVGIDPKAKRRVVEKTIQRPGQQNKGVSGTGNDPINANPPHYDDPSFRGQPSSYSTDKYSARRAGGGGGYGGQSAYGQGESSNGNGNNGGIESKVLDQVTQLVNQGHKISVEYADKRRYRSGIWKTGEAIDARRPAEAISALGKQLARHQGEYVRLIGTDPQAKRRVLEATIQRP